MDGDRHLEAALQIWSIRKQFLKEYRPIRYENLLLSGKLTAHLNQIDQEVTEQVEVLMKQMAEKQGVNENLKRQDQMKWVRLMNNIKVSAEEIVLKERVYMWVERVVERLLFTKMKIKIAEKVWVL